MVQLFVTIIFIAEVIIAASLVFNIYKLNIKIINANDDVEAYKKTIKRSFKEIRFALRVSKYKLRKFQLAIKLRQEEYTLSLIKNILIYLSLLSLRGKYKKVFVGYQMGKEIFEAIQEA